MAKRAQMQSTQNPLISRLQTEPSKQKDDFGRHTNARTMAEGMNRSLKYRNTFIPPSSEGKKTESVENARNKTMTKSTMLIIELPVVTGTLFSTKVGSQKPKKPITNL